MEKPNLLLIMCDQLRADVLGCYGNNLVKTPNIDRLAANGICFDRAYSTTPVCIPARHSVISGKNAFELGMLENTNKREQINDPLPRLIRDQDYYTCAVGKMHFVPTREHFGFDKMYLSEEVARHIQDDEYLQFLKKKGYGYVIEPHGQRSDTYYVPQVSKLPEELHSTAWVGDKTCEVIRRNRNRPFFLFSSFIKPHPPFDPCKPYDQMYQLEDIPDPVRTKEELEPVDRIISKQNDYKVNGIDNVSDKEIKKIKAHYYGSVSQVDKQIGEILDTLDKYELTKKTLIIFTADHGEMLGDHYAFGKRTYYEQSARVPFIVSWPEELVENKRRNQFVILQDIFTTFAETAGNTVGSNITGGNVLKSCKDKNKEIRNKIFAEFGFGKNLKFMLRWKDYKYMYFSNGGQEALFNLKDDPDELDDVADQNPDICQRCQQELVNYYRTKGFDEALDGDSLKKYDYEEIKKTGYLDQSPHWPETVVNDW